MSKSDGNSSRKRLNIDWGAPVAVLLAAGLLIAYELLNDLVLVAIAAVIAIALRLIVDAVKRLGAPTWIAPIATLLMIGASGAFLFLVVWPRLFEQADALASSVPGYLEELSSLSAQLPFGLASLVPELFQGPGGLGESLTNLISSQVSSLPQLLSSLSDVTVRTIIVVVVALYMAYDPGSIISGFLRLIPDSRREDARELMQNLAERLHGWVVGTGLAMIIVGTGAGVGLWLIGVPMALSFGILAGLLEIIPYFGPLAGALLPTLVALVISPVKALLVVGLFVVLHLVDANLIQPQILGRHTRLHPVVVIVSFLFLGDLLGFAGFILAIPGAAFLATLIDEIISKSPAYASERQDSE
jgi:predicted PurR-regulated permease PerM